MYTCLYMNVGIYISNPGGSMGTILPEASFAIRVAERMIPERETTQYIYVYIYV